MNPETMPKISLRDMQNFNPADALNQSLIMEHPEESRVRFSALLAKLTQIESAGV